MQASFLPAGQYLQDETRAARHWSSGCRRALINQNSSELNASVIETGLVIVSFSYCRNKNRTIKLVRKNYYIASSWSLRLPLVSAAEGVRNSPAARVVVTGHQHSRVGEGFHGFNMVREKFFRDKSITGA